MSVKKFWDKLNNKQQLQVSTLLPRFKAEVYDKREQIDPKSELHWDSLITGWLWAQNNDNTYDGDVIDFVFIYWLEYCEGRIKF